jgi:hypothetical protein
MQSTVCLVKQGLALVRNTHTSSASSFVYSGGVPR